MNYSYSSSPFTVEIHFCKISVHDYRSNQNQIIYFYWMYIGYSYDLIFVS
jgi:hypothetical protein